MKTQDEKDLSFKNKEHLALYENENIWIITAEFRFKLVQYQKKEKVNY